MYLKIKKIIEIILAIILIIVLFPFFVMIYILLKLSKIKSPIFKQQRSGKDNKIFTIYKFTTLDENNKTTKLFDFLRKTGIDELPQLFNILKGEMSFIGPRPWIIEYSKYFNKKQMKRLNVLPGITGLAQISDCENIFQKINKDIYYVDNLSFKLDIYVFFSTIKVILLGRKKDYSSNDINEDIELLKKQKKR